MKYFSIIGSLLVLTICGASAARAGGLEDLARYLEQQNAAKKSAFNSDVPPGYLDIIARQNRQIESQAKLDSLQARDSFLWAESARRETEMQMFADPNGLAATNPIMANGLNELGLRLRSGQPAQLYRYGR